MAFKKTFKKSSSRRTGKKITYKQLPASLRPEMKKIVRSLEGSSMSALTENQLVIAPFSHVTQGPGAEQRIGNDISLRGIHIKGHLENRSSVSNTMLVRMALIRDNKDMATPFSGINALIKGNTPVSLGALGAESSYLTWNKDRYSVIYDKTRKLGSSNTNGTDIQLFNLFKKIGGKGQYSYTIGAPGAINTGNWQMVMWACDPDNTGQSTSSVNGYFQVTGYYNDV